MSSLDQSAVPLIAAVIVLCAVTVIAAAFLNPRRALNSPAITEGRAFAAECLGLSKLLVLFSGVTIWTCPTMIEPQ